MPRPGTFVQQGGRRMDGRWGQRGAGLRHEERQVEYYEERQYEYENFAEEQIDGESS